MLRVLLVFALTLAVLVLLWVSWQQSRRLFTGVLAAVSAVLVFLGVAFWESNQTDLVAISPERVSLSVRDVRGLETGVRVSGRIRNGSDTPVAVVHAQVVLEECREGRCQQLATAPFTLRQHVPVGGDYPYSQIVRLPASLLSGTPEQAVEAVVLAVEGYAGAESLH